MAIPKDLLEEITAHFGRRFPTAYAEYLSVNEWLRDDGLLLYSAEDLIERNTTLGVQEYVDEFLGVGDDSGGSMIVIRFNDDSAAPFIIDGGALVPNRPASALKPLAKSWNEWQTEGFPLRH